ncbi:MAG: asparagine synthase (glutamine-hydrolyzing) [Selenomonadaceae bacterium]|nr:asparagine synthase (glutamine-hydrolyzing) [Selenomonadaceae bacterium]
MCGIAGFIDKKRALAPHAARIKRMTDALEHRGPDDEGQWTQDNVALGHRRLSIIDLDQRSAQPLVSADGRFVITYNGEVYNYIELRRELEARGAQFRTESDTEVIMEAYRHYGTDCFNMFNGMWALCIYDRQAQKLIFSRDRFGVKPLYILDNAEVFAFASEAKGIIAGFPEENRPSLTALYRFFVLSVSENADAESYYQNIKIFPPATYMIYDLTTNEKQSGHYWEVNEELFYEKWIKGRDPYQTFRELFDDAVAIRLRSDVEVGSCLSGGIDSSSIVGCMSRAYGRTVSTFSSVYQDKSCNEEAYIRAVNERAGTQAHYIHPDDEEPHFTAHTQKINYHRDGPATGASAFSQYMVMKCAGDHVKVVLDGQGADEMFAGYLHYYTSFLLDLLREHTSESRQQALRTLVIFRHEWPELMNLISTDAVVDLVGINNSDAFFNQQQDDSNMKVKRSFQPYTAAFLRNAYENYQYREYKLRSELNTRLCNDILLNSIPAILHSEDANSMCFSVESRIPFLDYRLVEFALVLDGRHKLHDQWTKWVVRHSLREYLPEKVYKRTNKMGFPAPFARWLRTGASRDEFRDIIFAFKDRNIVPEQTIRGYYDAHMAGKADMSPQLYRFYSGELWLRTCQNLEFSA